MKKQLAALCVCLALLCQPALALDQPAADELRKIQEYLVKTGERLVVTVPSPAFGMTGGEWAVFGLARGGHPVPGGYYEGYLSNVEKTLKEAGGNLTSSKYTEYSRLIIALAAIGQDPRNVAGYNLLEKISDLAKVKKQGVNGPIFALLAFDTRGYAIPLLPGNENQATRENLIAEILSREVVQDGRLGGFSLDGLVPDPDITAMALQALAPYRKDPKVEGAIQRALTVLEKLQQGDGGYAVRGAAGAEGAAQVVVALSTLGVDPAKTPAFTKTGADGDPHNPLSYLLAENEKAWAAGEINPMTAEQTLYALAAYTRFLNNQPPLYDMRGDSPPGKEKFDDLGGHWAKSSIEATRGFGITGGHSGQFQPDRPVTRAEFAAAVANALGLAPAGEGSSFADVPEWTWFKGQIKAAASCGILKGREANLFDPDGAITRQEAMAVVQRSAQYCGKDTSVSSYELAAYLARYPDGDRVAWWAMGPAAFNLTEGIILGKDGRLAPEDSITRAETVVVIERLLQKLGKTSGF